MCMLLIAIQLPAQSHYQQGGGLHSRFVRHCRGYEAAKSLHKERGKCLLDNFRLPGSTLTCKK